MHASQKDASIAAASVDDKRRFWSKVEKTDACWVWLGSKQKLYGLFWVKGETVRAHRAAKIWSTKRAASAGSLCCHSCNNPSCVRPSHIYWGSNAKNSADMIKNGKHMKAIRRGSRSSRALLTEEKAQAIAAQYFNGGVSAYTLASKYGVGRGAIDSILRGKNWRHCVNLPSRRLQRSEMGHKRGASVSGAKLTESKVLAIREMRRSGVSCESIAKNFGIAQTNVSAICNRLTWRHVK